jgi:pyruvate/2-oxoglutarate dehydrogenase complex dihydrolipoamide dehydrogenase (E3) component
MVNEHERVDALILGGGNGGMYLAWHLARTGKRTAVIERKYIGGSCPNINCLPSKNEIYSAKVIDLARHGSEFGIGRGVHSVDMSRVRQRKRTMVSSLMTQTLKEYHDSGAELIMGSGSFIAPKTIRVNLNEGGTRTLVGEHVFLNLGTHAAIPDIPGLAAAKPLTSVEGLDIDYAPPHLIVLGGGYVGLELAQTYNRFGSRVTVVHHGSHIAAAEDPDVSGELRAILASEGIEILEGAETLSVAGRSGEAVLLTVRTAKGIERVRGSDILVATGRIPNTADVGLDRAGVEVDERGYLAVNDRLQTTAPNVWGIGECCSGNPQFTHVSYDDFRIIRDNLEGRARSTSNRLVPQCMFSDPELARVGMTQKEAERRGIPFTVVKLPMSAVLRTQTTGETKGFMKALIGVNDRILGFTMIGSHAGEVMAAVQTAMIAGLPYTTLRDAVLAHPTMAEGLGTLFSLVNQS